MDRYPISYSPDMIRARREGRKRMTRRICRPQPKHYPVFCRPGITIGCKEEEWMDADGINPGRPMKCPYGKPGDLLWIREEHRIVSIIKDEWAVVQYRADETVSAEIRLTAADLERLRERTTPLNRWMQARFMLRSFCRSLDKVTAVRVEPLHSITSDDAIAEGIEPQDHPEIKRGWKNYTGGEPHWPKPSFMTLWESINGPDSWKANPWVWVVSFEPIIL